MMDFISKAVYLDIFCINNIIQSLHDKSQCKGNVSGHVQHVQWQIQDVPLGGGTNPLGLAKTYAKMKEIEPVGGACTGSTPPGSADDVSPNSISPWLI